MTTRRFLISAWQWNPWLVGLGATIILIYLARYRSPFRPRFLWLLAGLAVLYLALASPVEVLADGYLFSAHMLQHLLLILIVPPLAILSLPSEPFPGDLGQSQRPWLNWLWRHPLFTWLLGVGGMWVWHAPALCNAAVTNEWIHRLQYASLLVMGAGFWWPIITPWNRYRLSPPTGIIYLFSACVACTVLGIILTFSPVEVCSVYLHPPDPLAILTLIQDQWGLTPVKDQQLGGLLMWVPACWIYFCGIMVLFARWHKDGRAPSRTFDQPKPTLIKTPHAH